MWAYVLRRLIYNIPVYLTIVLIVMALLRVNNPVYAHIEMKNPSPEDIERKERELGLDRPFLVQYGIFLKRLFTLDFSQESWKRKGRKVSDEIAEAVWPTLSLTVPALVLTSVISISVGLISSFFRGQTIDRTLVILAVLGMSISFLVYIILGQYFVAYLPQKYFQTHDLEGLSQAWFAIEGYQPGVRNWFRYLLLPVLISVIVAMGYDTRFYRAVMVEETTRDYIVTARSKGATQSKIMFVHMLRNALIPIVTRIMITLPFLITGSILLEVYFGIPGMGKKLITAITEKDLPIIETFTALFAGLFIVSNILTDVLYALVDPRVRLS